MPTQSSPQPLTRVQQPKLSNTPSDNCKSWCRHLFWQQELKQELGPDQQYYCSAPHELGHGNNESPHLCICMSLNHYCLLRAGMSETCTAFQRSHTSFDILDHTSDQFVHIFFISPTHNQALHVLA
eukprot:1138558-Pelagomonas_calceolata.AAC.3